VLSVREAHDGREAREGQGSSKTPFGWSIAPVASNVLLSSVTGLNSKLLENVATAQKDWAEFVHQRVKEDIAASQQLLNCQSLTDMREIYSQYLRTAFEQYRDHSEKVVQRGKLMTEDLAQTIGGTAWRNGGGRHA